MKDISPLLITEQKKLSRKPALEIGISAFGHPAACSSVQWTMFGWQKLYSTDSINPNLHGVAIPQDGSLNRVRLSGSTIYFQRIANPSPSSDFAASWSNFGAVSKTAIAISATLAGPEVILFAPMGASYYLYSCRSTDNGQTFDSWAQLTAGVASQSIAAAHKTAAEMAACFADTSTGALKVVTRNAYLTWSSVYTLTDSPRMVALAMYFDGDYNIVGLVNRSDVLSLARIVFGQGYRVASNTFSDVVYLGLGSASIEASDLINQYMANLPPNSDFTTAREEYEDLLNQRWR